MIGTHRMEWVPVPTWLGAAIALIPLVACLAVGLLGAPLLGDAAVPVIGGLYLLYPGLAAAVASRTDAPRRTLIGASLAIFAFVAVVWLTSIDWTPRTRPGLHLGFATPLAGPAIGAVLGYGLFYAASAAAAVSRLTWPVVGVVAGGALAAGTAFVAVIAGGSL